MNSARLVTVAALMSACGNRPPPLDHYLVELKAQHGRVPSIGTVSRAQLTGGDTEIRSKAREVRPADDLAAGFGTYELVGINNNQLCFEFQTWPHKSYDDSAHQLDERDRRHLQYFRSNGVFTVDVVDELPKQWPQRRIPLKDSATHRGQVQKTKYARFTRFCGPRPEVPATAKHLVMTLRVVAPNPNGATSLVWDIAD